MSSVVSQFTQDTLGLFSGPIDAARIVIRWEGVHRVGEDGLLYPYICPAGYATIGAGNRVPTMQYGPITLAEGAALCAKELERCKRLALSMCPVLLSGPEQRLAAVISFVFNLGAGNLKASSMRRAINQRDWPEAGRQMRRWVWGGGRKLPGLILRREQEARMLESDYESSARPRSEAA